MKQILLALIFLLPAKLMAAACCGGGFNLPSLITGDDKAQLTTTISQSHIVDDVTSDGIWSKRANQDITQTFKLEGATLLSDRFQAGAGIPFSYRTIDSAESNSGTGDLTLVGAYELIPELEYSLWKPKTFLFSQIVAATGKSVYESIHPYGTDIMGRGFWSWGGGFALSKIIYDFDVQLIAEIHKSFDRTINSQGGDILLVPGWGQSFSFGGGYSYKDFRLGSALSFQREEAIRSHGIVNSDGAVQQFATATLQFNWLIQTDWAATATYSDQRLFGNPQNTTLSQIWALSLQKRWQR